MDKSLECFKKLKEIRAISDIWEYVLTMLTQEYQVSDDLLNLFCLFFSLIDDGNTCISLNEQELKTKWTKKLEGLNETDVGYYNTIIERGIAAINNYPLDRPLVFQYGNQTTLRQNDMFVIYNGWLFTEKFFNAKQSLEESVKVLFPGESNSDVDLTAIKNIQSKYNYTYKDSGDNIKKFELAEEQAKAIASAKNGKNLIITGGPGTGKTTVICYLLLELLSENNQSTIYMAAPNGKATKRMQESIIGAIAGLKEEIKQAQSEECEIISKVKPTTIHKLLGVYSVNSYKTKKFPSNSIFVIDEASMIDISLFAKLLNEIKQTENGRVFILGDQDQIPSVQPGAVFGDLIKTRKNCLIELTKTQRFPETSDIYKLKEYVRQANGATPVDLNNWQENIPDNWIKELKDNQEKLPNGAKKYPVKYLTLSKDSEIQKAATQWYDAFYDDEEYKKVYSDLDLQSSGIMETLDAIWSRLEKAKILCAENYGLHGTQNINQIICGYVKSKYNLGSDAQDDNFIGKQIIITQNQYFYDLSNGDIGIIVSLNNKKYVMIKRVKDTEVPDNTESQDIIYHKGNYIFYPLYLLPSESVESAYAITIHKSQGSEYENILVLLPDSENHPLLNRQILYTAITRTKNTTYIVSEKRCIEKAINTPVERDTRLFV